MTECQCSFCQATRQYQKEVYRYYAGKVKCKRISKMTPMKTALYRALEDGIIGTKDLGYRNIAAGELFIALVRRCYKKRLVV